RSPLFPSTTLFRSMVQRLNLDELAVSGLHAIDDLGNPGVACLVNEPIRFSPDRQNPGRYGVRGHLGWKTGRRDLGPCLGQVLVGALVVKRVVTSGHVLVVRD